MMKVPHRKFHQIDMHTELWLLNVRNMFHTKSNKTYELISVRLTMKITSEDQSCNHASSFVGLYQDLELKTKSKSI